MSDATLAQGHRLTELILREKSPHDFMQSLHENWGAVQKIGRGELTQAMIQASLQHIHNQNPYASEEVTPTFFYPEGYKPNSVEKQVEFLSAHLGWLDTSHVDALAKSWKKKYPKADGLYVVPKPTAVANHLALSDHWTNFGLLTEQGPLAALATQRKFTNYRAGQLGPDRYHLAATAASALIALEAKQPGDLLVYPAQTGKLYAGNSPRNARLKIEHAQVPSQWPQPSYCVGWMLYANPHRLAKYEHLVIDCSGDEYRLGAAGEFAYVLCFDFGGDGLHCAERWGARPYGACGSASGW